MDIAFAIVGRVNDCYEREADVANSILRELMGSRSLANNAMYESTVNRSTMIWLKWIGNMQIF